MYSKAGSLVILDVSLPDIDGWSILTRLRKGQDKDLPVIMLTGRSDVPDRLMGLDLGADDYIVKPFEPLEVVARVKAVLRRAGGASRQEGTIEFEGLALDIHGRMVTRNSKEVPTAKEFDVLAELRGNALEGGPEGAAVREGMGRGGRIRRPYPGSAH